MAAYRQVHKQGGQVTNVDLDLRRLEELGLNASAPPGQLLYDGWFLRLLRGQVKRARSVNAVYPSSLPLAEKLLHCEQVYRLHSLPLIFRITPFSEPAGLDDELAARGYPRFDPTAVESMPIDGFALAVSAAEPLDLPEWVDVVARLRGSPAEHRDTHLQRLQASPLPHRAMVLRQDGRAVATGLVVVEGNWAGLFDVVTDPASLRRGHARQIVLALLRSAWDMGARQAYLQVTTTNDPARALYARLGFHERYQYWYRGPTP